nr:cryptochrome/photolyase family protein [uncultured Rhodopila sp.]
MDKPIETLRVILGDQVSPEIAALEGLDPRHDVVLMAEVLDECTYVPHHLKKIVLVLAAMRHFARALAARGVRVRYVTLDDPDNTGSLRGEVGRAIAALQPRQVVTTEPGEYRVLQDMLGWADAVEIRPDTRFVCSIADFRRWAGGRNGLRMEFFYRDMRRRTGLLITPDNEPEGGRWNFDAENRKRLPESVAVPDAQGFVPDAATAEVIELVRRRFTNGFGELDGFRFAVTAKDARAGLDDFIARRLPGFGDWQDAMHSGQPVLFHAVISPALNIGLLDPTAVCRAVETAWRSGRVPLNAAEGFIRQIIGWREYVRGIYWLRMPEYGALNALGATRALPEFYWSGRTDMACIRHVVGQTRQDAYAHHIQRLMVTGNFALLAGLHPDAVDEWYLSVYADAYQWVEMPNTRGMALFADGGVLGSKPYAASGAYINRMSDYCRGCAYEVKDATGPRACPFNFLYWDFIARHAERFASNVRMSMPLRNWERMPAERRAAIRARAAGFLAEMEAGRGATCSTA